MKLPRIIADSLDLGQGSETNPAGTDPIKAFIIKGFGIVCGQAPAKDFFGRDDLVESMKSLWNKRVPSLITCRGEVAAVAAAEKSEACP